MSLRTTQRALNLVFRIPAIKENFAEVQRLIGLIYSTMRLWRITKAVIDAEILAEEGLMAALSAMSPMGWLRLGIAAAGVGIMAVTTTQSLTAQTPREKFASRNPPTGD